MKYYIEMAGEDVMKSELTEIAELSFGTLYLEPNVDKLMIKLIEDNEFFVIKDQTGKKFDIEEWLNHIDKFKICK